MFSITIEPTQEMYDAPINGQMVTTRIWAGKTSNGTPIEAYVLSIVPLNEVDADKMHNELPGFMVRSRDKFKIGTDEQRKQWEEQEAWAKSMHETGGPPEGKEW